MTTTAATQHHSGRPGRLRRFWRDNGAGYLFVAPSLVFFAVFIFVPLGWSFLISFQVFGLRQSVFIGLENYVRLLRDPIFHQAALNTVIYSIFTVGVWVLVAMVLATLIHPLPQRLRTFFRAAYYL